MSKADAISQAINRASLRNIQAEDVAKACMAAEVHPKITEVLMTLHHQNVQIDKELSEIRKSMLELAKVVATGADVAAISHQMMAMIAEKVGLDPSSLITAEADETSG